jgi:hypothetical protein
MSITYVIKTDRTERHIVVADSPQNARRILAERLAALYGEREANSLAENALITNTWRNGDGLKMTFYANHCFQKSETKSKVSED